MYHRSSSHSFIISLLTADRYSQHFHTKPWFQMVICPVSVCPSVHPSIKQCTVFVTSPWCPPMLSNRYILAFYWMFSSLCKVDSYFFTLLQDCIPCSKKKKKKDAYIYTICCKMPTAAVEKNMHFSCQSFMTAFRASCHCPSQKSKIQKNTTTSQPVLCNATAVIVKENNVNLDKQFCLICSLNCEHFLVDLLFFYGLYFVQISF